MGLWRVNFFGSMGQVNTAICLCITNFEQTLKIAMRVVDNPLLVPKKRNFPDSYTHCEHLGKIHPLFTNDCCQNGGF